jgi:DNA-binding NarL/FixJ family response regulator
MGSTNGRKYRILVADDHPMMRWGVRQRFNEEGNLEVVAEAADIPGALRGVEASRPDLMILDTTLDGRCGIELIKELRARYPEVKALVFSMQPEAVYAERAIRAGALGFVSKKEDPSVLLQAVRSVLAGDTVLSKHMTDRFVKRAVHPGGSNGSGVACLSDRELEVIMLLGEGLSGPEIAHRLSISDKTVNTHKRNLKTKLNLPSSAALMRFAAVWVDAGSPEALPDRPATKRAAIPSATAPRAVAALRQ